MISPTPARDPGEQRNTGTGTFVSGNVFGGVHNYHQALDEETKAHLAQIAKTSPDLAKLLVEAAARSSLDTATVELIATTARRFHLADSAELLSSAVSGLERMAFTDSVELLASTAAKLARLAPQLLAAADQLGSGRHGHRN